MKFRRLLIAILRWVGRILLVVVCLFLGLVAFLLLREAAARRQYQTEYPPPGRMVNLGTHAIHLNCTGDGQPTVVFESDLDAYGSLSWAMVQDSVAEFTRACSYDRAGILWSEAGPHPRDGEQIANELAALLEEAGEEGPYVLVGHAFGGLYVRIFAGQHPADVCGMVLVDSSHPDQFQRFAEIGFQKEIPQKQVRPLIWLLSHLGSPGRFNGPRYNLPDSVYDPQQAFLPVSSMAWYDESVETPSTLAQSGKYEDLGNLPLIVLASARSTSVSTQASGKDLQETWLELQQELTLLSENSEIRMLPGSGHYIQYDQPEEVLTAVREVVQRCAEDLP